MRRHFGWPDSFRREAWGEVMQRVCAEAYEAEERLDGDSGWEVNQDKQLLDAATAEVVSIVGIQT